MGSNPVKCTMCSTTKGVVPVQHGTARITRQEESRMRVIVRGLSERPIEGIVFLCSEHLKQVVSQL